MAERSAASAAYASVAKCRPTVAQRRAAVAERRATVAERRAAVAERAAASGADEHAGRLLPDQRFCVARRTRKRSPRSRRARCAGCCGRRRSRSPWRRRSRRAAPPQSMPTVSWSCRRRRDREIRRSQCSSCRCERVRRVTIFRLQRNTAAHGAGSNRPARTHATMGGRCARGDQFMGEGDGVVAAAGVVMNDGRARRGGPSAFFSCSLTRASS